MRITPTLVDASTAVENALQTHKGRASVSIEGVGGTLLLQYQSGEPLEIYMVPLSADKRFVPTDYVHFTLPQADNGSATIDLTVSPGWSFHKQRWALNLLSVDEKAGAQFTNIQFTNASLPTTLKAVAQHLMTEEPYTPSSYHALRGYRMLGISVTVIFGLMTLIVVFLCLAFARASRRRALAIRILVIAMLLYQARFSVDLLRYTQEHLIGFAHGVYDEAGSVNEMAKEIRSLGGTNQNIFVCRDGTNFKEKLLRYFVYPVHVSADTQDANVATLAVVMDTFKHGYRTTPTDLAPVLRLQCGPIDRLAEQLHQFPDGAVLFKLLPSSAPRS